VILQTAKRWLWSVPAAVLLALIFANLFNVSAAFPGSCRVCHRMAYKGWAASPHKSVYCNSCHQKQGFTGQASWRLRVLSMFGSTVIGNTNASSRITRKTCLACHDGIRRGVVKSKNLIMSHAEVIEDGPNCGECHRKEVHGKGPQYKLASMDKCLKCHLEEDADLDCFTCHVENARLKKSKDLTPWRIAHGPKWRSNHALLDIELCRVCHTSEYCFRCHQIRDLPHSAGWLNSHGKIAKGQREDCLVCHRESLCQGCHDLNMPHGDQWLSQHSTVAAERGTKICLDCHMARGCDDCHERHIHAVKLERIQDGFMKQGQTWGGLE